MALKDPYQTLSKVYDLLVGPPVAVLRRLLLKVCPPAPGMRVLEIGCGTGANLWLYRQAGCRIHGIDLSFSMAKKAAEKLGGSGIVSGDASRLPYSDGVFDLVVAMLTLHEMPGPKRLPVLAEMKRVLKPEGRILLVDYQPGRPGLPGGRLYRLILRAVERIAGREHFSNYRHFMSENGLLPLIRTARLHVESRRITGRGNLAVFSAGIRDPSVKDRPESG